MFESRGLKRDMSVCMDTHVVCKRRAVGDEWTPTNNYGMYGSARPEGAYQAGPGCPPANGLGGGLNCPPQTAYELYGSEGEEDCMDMEDVAYYKAQRRDSSITKIETDHPAAVTWLNVSPTPQPSPSTNTSYVLSSSRSCSGGGTGYAFPHPQNACGTTNTNIDTCEDMIGLPPVGRPIMLRRQMGCKDLKSSEVNPNPSLNPNPNPSLNPKGGGMGLGCVAMPTPHDGLQVKNLEAGPRFTRAAPLCVDEDEDML